MASQILLNSTLRLVFDTGVDPETGSMTTKTKSFNNVKRDATADELYTVARTFEELQAYPIYNIERRDTSDIAGE